MATLFSILIQVARKEYRGQRSVDAIVDFVRSQLNPPVEVIKSTAELAEKVSPILVNSLMSCKVTYTLYMYIALSYLDSFLLQIVFGSG